MQLAEQSRMALDERVGRILSGLAALYLPQGTRQGDKPQSGRHLITDTIHAVVPERSYDFVLFPESASDWGLSYTINRLPSPTGQCQLRLTPIIGSTYWLDPQKRLAAVILTQLLPSADGPAVALFGALNAPSPARSKNSERKSAGRQ
jgi:hypothetical protein